MTVFSPPPIHRAGLWAYRCLEDKDLLTLQRYRPQRYPYLLESVAQGTSQARYDILFAFPGAHLITSHTARFLPRLDAWWKHEFSPHRDNHLPFQGGWFIYLGYELAGEIEPKLALPSVRSNIPTAFATRIPAAIIRDHDCKEMWLMAEEETLLAAMARDLNNVSPYRPSSLSGTLLEEETPIRFLTGVRKIKNYIAAGDVFQVNLSRRWSGTLPDDVDCLQAYAALRYSNPAPFSASILWEQNAILSSSPERLVRVHGDRIETRPIAGTRPRGRGQSSDLAYSQELLAHPKERAEHTMLLDLERNDLGRVCRPGSIKVDELMSLESYAHVHHIVSNVSGHRQYGVSPGQILAAVFPGGTITGCPKVRCMEIIAELEKEGRGPYTGALGYLNRNGDMDFNILIRTLWIEGRHFVLRAGAGIVADSDAEAELAETRAKAKGLVLALGACP